MPCNRGWLGVAPSPHLGRGRGVRGLRLSRLVSSPLTPTLSPAGRGSPPSLRHRDGITDPEPSGRGVTLDLLLTEPQSLFAETATRLAADHGGPRRLRALRADGAEIDAEAWRAAVTAEWLATVVAERHGGQGLGLFELALALEQAGRQLLMVPVLEGGAAAWTLSQAEDDARAAAALADLLQGPGLIVPATEAASWRYGGGSSGIRYDHRAGVLEGSLAFVAYGETADAYLVAMHS